MLILSNVEYDARSLHYFSFFFSFVLKRSIEIFLLLAMNVSCDLDDSLNDVETNDCWNKENQKEMRKQWVLMWKRDH